MQPLLRKWALAARALLLTVRMYIYQRVLLFLGLGASLLITGASSTALPRRAPLAAPVRWQLQELDGQPAPGWLHQPSTQLLLALQNATTGSALQSLRYPQTGTCEPTVSNRVLGSAHLISTVLRANDTAMQNELRYLHLLEELTSYEISGNSLRLYDEAHPAPRVVFTAATAAPLAHN